MHPEQTAGQDYIRSSDLVTRAVSCSPIWRARVEPVSSSVSLLTTSLLWVRAKAFESFNTRKPRVRPRRDLPAEAIDMSQRLGRAARSPTETPLLSSLAEIPIQDFSKRDFARSDFGSPGDEDDPVFDDF